METKKKTKLAKSKSQHENLTSKMSNFKDKRNFSNKVKKATIKKSVSTYQMDAINENNANDWEEQLMIANEDIQKKEKEIEELKHRLLLEQGTSERITKEQTKELVSLKQEIEKVAKENRNLKQEVNQQSQNKNNYEFELKILESSISLCNFLTFIRL